MKILKPTGTYLEEQAKTNRKISFPLIVFGFIGLLYSFLSANFELMYIFIITLMVGGIFLKIYLNYSSGLEAENLITECLSHLDDRYYLINDVKLPESYGNVDHILLGPNGIFVIETKNYSGKISCNSDEWIRHYEGGAGISMRGNIYFKPDKDYSIGSPSRQVKRNAVKIKQVIGRNIWVEGIIVFTNPNVELQLSGTTTPILQIDELCDYIKNKKSKISFSPQELDSIGKTILKADNHI